MTMTMTETRPVYMVEDMEGCVRETFAKHSDSKEWFDQYLFDNGIVGVTFEKDPLGHHTLVFCRSRVKNKLVGRILTISIHQSAFPSSDGW